MGQKEKLWSHLKPNDLIDIVAPASRCSDEEFKKGLEKLESWGYRTRVQPHIFGDDVICAQTDQIRFQQLKKALYARDSKAVWCVRGGYGAIRLTDALMKMKKPAHTKLFVGYSDMTTIHHYLNQFWKWPTLHACMIDRLGRGNSRQEDLRELKAVLSGEKKEVVYSDLKAMNKSAQKKLKIQSAVFGGNLMVANSTLGGPMQKPYSGIVFFEETSERGYRVDRLLTQLSLAGAFKKTKAIVFGNFIGGLEADGRDMVTPVLERFAQEQKIPVYRGVEAGHGDLQRPVPLATRATLHSQNGVAQLTVESGAKD